MRGGVAFLKDYMSEANAAFLLQRGEKDAMHDMLLCMQKNDMGILYRDDMRYPDQLLNIENPPVFLFWRGDPDCLSRRCLTFVGSRHATLQAEQVTVELTRELSRRGVTIVSGMAQGIDQAAHRGCIEGGSPTVGVLGCGLDVPYPSGTQKLKRQVL